MEQRGQVDMDREQPTSETQMTSLEPAGRPGPAADDPIAPGDDLGAALAALGDRPPTGNLWPGIEARLAPGRAVGRSVTMTFPQLAMAASLLIAVSAGVSWLALQPGEGAPTGEPAIRAVAEPRARLGADVNRVSFADEQFDAAVADLERIVREERQTLDPQTVLIIERSLQAIDEAIRQSRAALDGDPANTYLNSHLADARRRKLDLLRRAAGLSNGGD
jgi:hypothetical protein